MIARSTAATVAVIGALVFTGSTPAAAADNTAIKRAIIETVLTNLGVEPTAQLVNDLIGDIPMDVLDSTLVQRVSKSLDSSGDVTTIISETVDSDGDGIPDENAATEAAESDDDDDESDDDSSSNSGSGNSNSGSSNSGSTGTGGTTTGSNDDEDEDEPEDEPEDTEDPEDEPEDEDEPDN